MSTYLAYVAIAALLAGLLCAAFIIFTQARRGHHNDYAQLVKDANELQAADPEQAIKLRLQILQARDLTLPWYQRAMSAMGVLAFVAALVALVTQTIQNFALQSRSALESEQLELFRAQSERAERVVAPLVNSILNDFDKRGDDPNADETALLRFAVDRWLSEPALETPEYKEEMLNAFRAALIAGDYAAAVRIHDRLGENVAYANKVEQISVIEYLFTTGLGSSAEADICRLLATPGRLPSSQHIKLLAIALNMGLVDDRDAVVRATRILSTDAQSARDQLRRSGVHMREAREKVLAVLPGDGRVPDKRLSSTEIVSSPGCAETT